MERFTDVDKKGYFVKLIGFVSAVVLSAAVLHPVPAHSNASENARDISQDIAPSILNAADRQQYAAVFAAIKSRDWANAQQLIEKIPSGPAQSMARAQFYTAPGSPLVDAAQLESLLRTAPYLPQAAQLERMAIKRGSANLPLRPGINRFSYLGSAPKRDLPDNVMDAGALRSQIQLNIRNDDPAGAEAIVEASSGNISASALTELRYRVAWSYYIENDDINARRVSSAARGTGGDWGVQAQWVYALSNWRLKDYNAAIEGFENVARFAGNDDLRAAGMFWSARASMAAKRPNQIQSHLQSAARLPETFYGLLASEALGMEPLARKQARAAKLDWGKLKKNENVQIAVALSQIGETSLADETIRFQSRIGNSNTHSELAQLAGSLNLPATQLWLGHYGPAGGNSDALARYPTPNWQPSGGWRVDPSLIFAHSLQESAFRTSVISPAGARGLMQLRPGTAGDLARDRGASFNAQDLDRPSVNLEYGQSYLEKLRDMPATGGLLPKVIAAYNAGPAPISRWNTEIRDNGDPLLFVESIPYWETRGYVAIILRNYWMYEMRGGKSGGSMKGLAQYLWPQFPGKNGSVAVRVQGGSLAAR
jgi:soluble lytic murein transglycosylase